MSADLSRVLPPAHRTVVLKPPKVGMGSRQFVVRFEAERKALAVMNRPSSNTHPGPIIGSIIPTPLNPVLLGEDHA